VRAGTVAAEREGQGLMPTTTGMEERLLAVIRGERNSPGAAAARAALAALACAYAAGLKTYLLSYSLGLRRRHRLPCPVVSVGNLTVGGTGKTSLTLWLAERLRDEGRRLCILSRGYRGASEHGAAIVSDCQRVRMDARAAGDEAWLLARLLPGVPVVAGKDRRRTGQLACREFRPDLILLDDGMQYYQLHRDLDIALVNSARPFDNGWTFPRGLLREPPSHLRRAGCVVVTGVDRVSPRRLEELEARLRRLAPRAELHRARRVPRSLRPLAGGADLPLDWAADRRVAAFCALGDPEAFERQVEELGAALVHRARLRDHAEPTLSQLTAVLSAAREAGAEAVIVSEKDAVKLPPLSRPLPLVVLAAPLRVDDEERLLGQIRRAAGL